MCIAIRFLYIRLFFLPDLSLFPDYLLMMHEFYLKANLDSRIQVTTILVPCFLLLFFITENK